MSSNGLLLSCQRRKPLARDMEQETQRIDEMVEIEEGRPAGPLWAEAQQEVRLIGS